MSRSILVVDDDPAILRALRAVFQRTGWAVSCAAEARGCLEAYERERADLVLLDHDLPGLSGLQLLELIRQRDPEATVLMLTGNGDIPTAVEAMRLGAENFLTKPVNHEQLGAAVARAYEKVELRRQNQFLRERRTGNVGLESLGHSPAMQDVVRDVAILAPGTAPVLLGGETGTGKGWVAQIIHSLSPRAQAPFVEVNCAGLTATFLDSELFGHEKGAFTDAKSQKPGLFEVADGGTLFLDEIGDLAPELQPKLLKVLESRRFRRLGGTRELEVDVRMVAATHRDLAAEVRSGRFREDLYYRLAVFPVHLPALRERGREAIVELVHRLLRDFGARGGRAPTRLSDGALALLARHAWPGNVRELKNTLERAVLFAGDADEIVPAHLPAELRAPPSAAAAALPSDGDFSLATAERRHVARVLAHFGDNRAQAARALGITRATLYRKLRGA